MNRRKLRQITFWMIALLIILGCASPGFVTPPPSEPTQRSLDNIIEQTVAVAQAQTASSIPPSSTPISTPTLTKTPTSSPTPTATILFITDTSVPDGFLEDQEDLEDPTDESDSDGDEDTEDSEATKTPRPREWDCRVLSKSPALETVIIGGTNFNATWTVENIGTKTWPKQGVDVVYHTGAHLHTGKSWLDIPTGVSPGGKVTISVPMTVPKHSETYSTRWSLQVGQRKFCAVKFVVIVK